MTITFQSIRATAKRLLNWTPWPLLHCQHLLDLFRCCPLLLQCPQCLFPATPSSSRHTNPSLSVLSAFLVVKCRDAAAETGSVWHIQARDWKFGKGEIRLARAGSVDCPSRLQFRASWSVQFQRLESSVYARSFIDRSSPSDVRTCTSPAGPPGVWVGAGCRCSLAIPDSRLPSRTARWWWHHQILLTPPPPPPANIQHLAARPHSQSPQPPPLVYCTELSRMTPYRQPWQDICPWICAIPRKSLWRTSALLVRVGD